LIIIQTISSSRKAEKMDNSQMKTASVQVWGDVTELCRKAAAEMTNLAPMVHTEEFSLLDSMSAVEV